MLPNYLVDLIFTLNVCYGTYVTLVISHSLNLSIYNMHLHLLFVLVRISNVLGNGTLDKSHVLRLILTVSKSQISDVFVVNFHLIKYFLGQLVKLRLSDSFSTLINMSNQ